MSLCEWEFIWYDCINKARFYLKILNEEIIFYRSEKIFAADIADNKKMSYNNSYDLFY